MKPPLLYGKTHVGDLLVRPDSQSVLQKAAKGHPIDVSSSIDYVNLFHVFERMQARDSRLRKLRLVRRQIGPRRWRLFVVANDAKLPAVQLEDGYDPKRGRYQRLAGQLAAGEALTLPSKTEAIKARRAWQLYVRPDERRHLTSTVRPAGRSGEYRVKIIAREPVPRSSRAR